MSQVVEWVKLSDRKPPRDGMYLFFAESYDPENPIISILWYDATKDSWRMSPAMIDIGITHWMELPEPPAS